MLALMTAAAALSLDEAVSSIQAAGSIQASEMIKSGLEHGLDVAMSELQQADEALLANPPPQWDIFAQAQPVLPPGPPLNPAGEFLGSMPYPPPPHPYANQFLVRFGMRPGQRGRAPAGEDINKSYGQIVELQVGIEAVGAGMPPAEERVSVGILIPRRESHAN